MTPAACGFLSAAPVRSEGDEEGFFSCKMNGLYRELQAFIKCLGIPTHDGIFAFCRAATCSVCRTDPGRALAPCDARCCDGRGPVVAMLDAGGGALARALAGLARGGARRGRRSHRSARARRHAAF